MESLIVDQNFLRKQELKALADTKPNNLFILPDVALIEMCKSPQWRNTLCGSLSILSNYPGRTRVCISTGEAIMIELETQNSISDCLLPDRYIPIFEELLLELFSENTGQMLEKIPLIQASLASNYLNHKKNQNDFKSLIEESKSIITSEKIKSLRNGSMSRKDKLDLIYNTAHLLLKEILKENNFTSSNAEVFLKKKPMILRYYYLKIWSCLDWLGKGGFESLLPKDVTNEILDHEYILLATFFNGILSKENRVNKAYKDISDILHP